MRNGCATPSGVLRFVRHWLGYDLLNGAAYKGRVNVELVAVGAKNARFVILKFSGAIVNCIANVITMPEERIDTVQQITVIAYAAPVYSHARGCTVEHEERREHEPSCDFESAIGFVPFERWCALV